MKNTIKKAIKVAGLNIENFIVTKDEFATGNQAEAAAVTAELRKMGVSIKMEVATRSRWDGPKDSFGAMLGQPRIANPDMY